MDLPANLQAALWSLLRMLSPIPLVPVPFPFHPPGKVKYLGYNIKGMSYPSMTAHYLKVRVNY